MITETSGFSNACFLIALTHDSDFSSEIIGENKAIDFRYHVGNLSHVNIGKNTVEKKSGACRCRWTRF